MSARIDGIETVLSNLNKEINGIKNRALNGLYAAGLKVQADAQKRAPHAFGNLTNSAYTRKDQHGLPEVEVGFSASYALFVHEMVEQKLKGQERPRPPGGHYWDKGEPKFLENALREKRSEIVETIRKHAQVKR